MRCAWPAGWRPSQSFSVFGVSLVLVLWSQMEAGFVIRFGGRRCHEFGGVAQMVERSLSMRQVVRSMLTTSTKMGHSFFVFCFSFCFLLPVFWQVGVVPFLNLAVTPRTGVAEQEQRCCCWKAKARRKQRTKIATVPCFYRLFFFFSFIYSSVCLTCLTCTTWGQLVKQSIQ